MRKKEREVTDRQEIIEIMRGCDVCRLGLNDEDGYPYVVPLNFGLEVLDGRIRLYFHGATEGHKLDLIRRDDRAFFEMDRKHELQYIEEKGYCTMNYESVMGKGRLRSSAMWGIRSCTGSVRRSLRWTAERRRL